MTRGRRHCGRCLGDGARGTSDDNEDEFGDGFTSNWIDTVTISLGFSYRLPRGS
ncbi:hypothetical protein [Myxococcus xanthus]|uniref:hypothetical protein n=1 Tax=Myxococcus xanthus TaxID=34 RepID=UPI001F2D5ACF|nr:hypothetical protein [Myxococcus xanthus]